jgi:hypothetical protein
MRMVHTTQRKAKASMTIDAERLECATADAREVLREVHGVLTDMRAAIKDAKQTFPSLTREAIHVEVDRQLTELGKTTERAMRESVAKVDREFTRLADIYLGRDGKSRRAGKRDLPTIMESVPPKEEP